MEYLNNYFYMSLDEEIENMDLSEYVDIEELDELELFLKYYWKVVIIIWLLTYNVLRNKRKGLIIWKWLIIYIKMKKI